MNILDSDASYTTKTTIFRISANLLDVADEGVTVLLPVVLQHVFMGKLVTAKLQSDLKAVAAQIIEILHPCMQKGRKLNCKIKKLTLQVKRTKILKDASYMWLKK